MNNIDTILISLVVILVIVVVLRIAIQRYKLSHSKLPDNIREVGGSSADTIDEKKKTKIRESLSTKIESTVSNEKEEKIELEENLDLEKKENLEEEGENLKTNKSQTESESESESVSLKGNNTDKQPSDSDINNIVQEQEKEIKKEDTYELDYQQLITDPVSILKDNKAPSRHKIAAIREIGYQKLSSAVPELINALYDSDSSVSLVAAESLGIIGDSRAIEPLLEISKQNDDDLCKAAEEYIGGAMVVAGDQPVDNHSSQQTKDAAPCNYKEMVVFKVDQLPLDYFQPDGSPIPRKELVIKGLNDNNEQMRQMAAKAAIGIEESEEVIEPLSRALTNTLESEAIRSMAAEALGGMGSEKSITALIKALNDENVAVRYASATALSGRSEPKVVEALIRATRDSDKFVRASAAYALGTTGATVALKALIKCAEDEDEAVRFSAVKAISGYRFDDVYKRISDKTSGLESKNQIFAKIEILSQFKDNRAVEILKNYLDDPDSEICYKASMALMGQENQDVIDELVNASYRLDQELYQLAKENVAPEVFTEITKFNSNFNFVSSYNQNLSNEKSNNEKDFTNGNVPPSRQEAINNTIESVKARNAKKSEAILNINPNDYSGEIFFNMDDKENNSEEQRKDNRGFNNEELDYVEKKEEELTVELEDISSQKLSTEEGFTEETYENQNTTSFFGNQPLFVNNEVESIEQTNFEEIVDEEDLPLEQITGLPVEFDRIRKKLLDDSPVVRGNAANTLGDYPQSRESITLLRGVLNDRNESVRVAAVNSLGRIANSDALKLILTCEKDMSTEVRYAVVKALSDIPDYSAIEALKRMANSDISIDVKRNARLALEKLS